MIVHQGQVVTFYSYDEGVGRSFLTANVAATLAAWGNSVVCVDWDLEEAALHRYFAPYVHATEPGLLELTEDIRAGRDARWSDHLTRVEVPGAGRIDFIAAGPRGTPTYRQRVQSLNWNTLYDEYHFGTYLEQLRSELKSAYDFVLMDSRTGLTEVGAICAVQLPDLLVAVVGPNERSVDGTINVADRIPPARDRLVFDRLALPVVPVISHADVSDMIDFGEPQVAMAHERLAYLCRPWLPVKARPIEMLSCTTLPAIPESLRTRLATVDSRTYSRPDSLSWAVDNLSALLMNGLEHSRILLTDRDQFVRQARTLNASRAMSYDLYISAPARYGERVEDLADALREGGLLTFTNTRFDPELAPITDQVQAAIRASRHLVLVIDERLEADQQFELEAFLSETVQRNTDSHVVVVWVGTVRPAPRGLSQIQALEWTGKWSTAADIELALQLRWRGDTSQWIASLEQRLRNFRRDHDVVAATRRRLAQAYLDRGKPADAVLTAQALLADLEEADGSDSARTLLARALLAMMYHAAGQLPEAREQYQIALDGQSRTLGETHPQTLRTRYGLGRVFHSAHRLTEARQQFKLALNGQRKVLGPNHPDTLRSGLAIARVLVRRGQLTQAIQMYQQILERMTSQLGPRHPETLQAGALLARAYRLDNRLSAAISAFRRIRDEQMHVLGAHHQDTLGTQARLASALQARGQLHDAEGLFQETLNSQRHILGTNHPEFLQTQVSLADVWVARGRVDEAIDLYRLALVGQRRMLGHDHPDTLQTELRLVKAHALSDRTAPDSDLERVTLETVEGYLHETMATARDRGDLELAARTLHQLGAVEAQRERYDSVISYYEDALRLELSMGNRRAAATTNYQLGLIAQRQGRPDQAARYFERASAEAEAGQDTSTCIAAQFRLGELAARDKRPEDVLDHYRKALDTAEEDDDRAAALVRIGEAMVIQGENEEAEEHYRQALAIEPDTYTRARILRNLAELAMARGQLDVARNWYEQALDAGQASDENAFVSEVAFRLGRLDGSAGASDQRATAGV